MMGVAAEAVLVVMMVAAVVEGAVEGAVVAEMVAAVLVVLVVVAVVTDRYHHEHVRKPLISLQLTIYFQNPQAGREKKVLH